MDGNTVWKEIKVSKQISIKFLLGSTIRQHEYIVSRVIQYIMYNWLVLEYDAVLGKVNVMSSKTLDVSSGMLHLSASQKASIVEGVGRDIDLGMYEMKAKDLVSTSLMSSERGMLYSNKEGKIVSMEGVRG